MTFGEVFRFEVGYRLRHPSTWVHALVLFGFPFLMMHAINGSSQHLNAPLMVANASALLGGLALLVTAGIFGDAATRDVRSGMHALFYTSPLREAHYLGGRFLGGVAVNAALLLGVPLGLLLASVMPYMEAGKFGPVQPAAYVQAYLLLLLPNLVVVGAIMFAVAALTRQPLATYLAGTATFLLGSIAGKLTDGLSGGTLAALADPSGARAVGVVTRYWTPAETGVQLIGWPHLLLWNRLLWLAVAAGVLALLVARFRFAHPGVPAGRRRWTRRPVADTAPERAAPIAVGDVPGPARSFSAGARVRQTLEVAVHAWREVAATRAFLVILAGALVFVFAFGWDVGSEIFGTSTWPVTHLVAGTVLGAALAPVMALLVALLAGELVWRERDVGMGDIGAVAPVPDGVELLGRFLALVAMLVTVQAVLMGAGVLLQALRGYHRYEPGVYLQILFGVKLADYVLLGVLAMAVHVVVNQKYLGHLIVVLYFACTVAPELIGLRHHMLVYGSDPGWVWSDFNGLAPFAAGLVWFKLYWAAWALLLAVAASLFWVRGREHGARARLTLAARRFRGPARVAAATAAMLIVTLGGFVFYNTDVLNANPGPDEAAALRAGYERRYKRFQDAPQPSLVAARLRVELYPADRAADLRGTFRLVNRTGQPIDSLHVLPGPDVETRALGLDRASRLAVDDSAMHYRIYVLERPLAPGDSLSMTFRVASHPRGFRNAGAPTDVTPNGAYLDRRWLPAVGYRADRELMDERARRDQGLPPRRLPAAEVDAETREPAAESRDLALVDAETVIGTDARQTAVAPGALMREWRQNGRRYFHYRTAATAGYSGAVLSARYAVREARWGTVRLRVYHHPAHDVNVDRMIRSMQASLAYYSRQFGPYPYRELSIVEFPRYASFARAHPQLIAFSEGSAFLTRVDGEEVDRPFFVVAHETAHQWWGGQVIPGSGPGAAMVSETLAQYSSMMVLETTHGPEAARRFYDYNMDEYLRGRSVYTNREVPLLDVVNHKYLHYFKGAVAMYTLRERLGADAVNGALRRFHDRYSAPGARRPTSRDLYAELRAVAPDSVRPLLADLFEHITLWNVRTDSARAEPVGGGAYRVTLYVDASKVRADSIGKETPVPMDDLVEVGAFAAPRGGAPGETLYLRQQRIRSGRQTIVFTVPRLPASAGIDPHRKLIERTRDDNVAAIAVAPGPGVR